jgi:hypothetical protein
MERRGKVRKTCGLAEVADSKLQSGQYQGISSEKGKKQKIK